MADKDSYYELKVIVTFKNSEASECLPSEEKLMKCRLHEYAYLSYVKSSRSTLKDVNTFLKKDDRLFKLDVADGCLIVKLLASDSVSSADVTFVRDCVADFGKECLIFEIFSSAQEEQIKKSIAKDALIRVHFEQVSIDGEKKYAAVFAKDIEDAVRRILQTVVEESGIVQQKTLKRNNTIEQEQAKAEVKNEDLGNIETISVKDPLIYQYLCQVQILESLKSYAAKENVSLELSEDENTKEIIISGEVKAGQNIKAYMQRFVDTIGKKSLEVRESDNLEDVLRCAAGEHSVQCSVQGKGGKKWKSWQLKGGQRIRVLLGNPDESGAKFVADVSEGSRRTIEQEIKLEKKRSHFVAQVSFPKRKDDKVHPKRLTDSFQMLFKVCREHSSDDEYLTLALDPDKSRSWSLALYLQTLLVAMATQSLAGTKDIITICTSSQNTFDDSCKYLDTASTGVDIIHAIQVEVLEGSLDQTKADVLVCTVNESLDLRRGATSAALSRMAGPQLQQELKRNYPNGIDVAEVAYADGYKLPCKKVYLMAIQPSRREEVDAKMSVDKVMVETLRVATEQGHKSLAFPAIGSGQLQYPLDTVAQQMFESVHDFQRSVSTTSVDTVKIIIYQGDTEALKVFREAESRFRQTVQKTKVTLKPCPCKVQLVGPRENMKKAKADILNRTEQSSIMKMAPGETMIQLAGVFTEERQGARSNFSQSQRATSQRTSQKMDGAFTEEKQGARSKFSQSLWASKSVQDSQKTAATTVNSSLPRTTIPISENSYQLLQHFFKEELSENLYYRDGNIVLFGDVASRLESAEKALLMKLKELHNLNTDNVVFASCENIKEECRKHSNRKILCRPSSDDKSIDIYGFSYEEVSKVKHQLRITSGEDSVTGGRERNFVSPLETSTREITKVTPGAGRELLQRQFSWKTDTENLKLFDMDKMLVKVYVADILNLPVEGIVNAANSPLQHGGGVAKVISKAAGRELDEDCQKYVTSHGRLQTGEVFASVAGNLPYKCVLHAVGPEWANYKPHTEENIKRCERDLHKTVLNSFIEAEFKRVESVAFPAVSSAIFGCPFELCAVEYAKAIVEYRPSSTLKEIHFVDKNESVVDLVQCALDCLINRKIKPNFYNRSAYVQRQASSTGAANSQNKGSRQSQVVATTGKGCDKQAFPYCVKMDRGDGIVCHLGMGQALHIYQGDIFSPITKGDIFVCSENAKGSCAGFVSAKLAKYPKYKAQKENAFGKKTVKRGDVVVCRGLDTGFRHVAHAILYLKTDYRSEGERRQIIEAMFLQIFEQMKFCTNSKSIIMPLLGTGKGTADPEFYIECIFRSLQHFVSKNPGFVFDVFFVNKDGPKNKMAIDNANVMFSKKSSANLRGAESVKPTGRSKPPAVKPLPASAQPSSQPGDRGARPGSASKKNMQSVANIRTPATDEVSGRKHAMSHVKIGGAGHNATHGKSSMNLPTQRSAAEGPSVHGKHSTKGSAAGGTSVHGKHSMKRSAAEGPSVHGKHSMKGSAAGGTSVHGKHSMKGSAAEGFDVKGQDRSSRSSFITDEQGPESLGQSEDCVICMDAVRRPKRLKCGHVFCTECIDLQFKHKPACPTCGTICGTITGDQPDGNVSIKSTTTDCPGYAGVGRIEITYHFPDGFQKSHHPSPGKPYKGLARTAYLPNNKQGRNICKMLKVAFERKLVFTLGRSTTTGKEGVITWNDIHHKTDPKPNTQFGYPDPSYLDRVTEELKAKGVTEADI